MLAGGSSPVHGTLRYDIGNEDVILLLPIFRNRHAAVGKHDITERDAHTLDVLMPLIVVGGGRDAEREWQRVLVAPLDPGDRLRVVRFSDDAVRMHHARTLFPYFLFFLAAFCCFAFLLGECLFLCL